MSTDFTKEGDYMAKFVLSTDTTCDAFKSELKNRDIEYIPMCFISDGEIHYDNFDKTEDYLNFYQSIDEGKMYSTTGLNHMEIEEYFTKLIDTYHQDIVHLCLSSGLSLTCGLVKQVANHFNETHKEQIYVVDSLAATQASYYLLHYLQKYRDEGLSAIETYSKINNDIEHLDVSFFVSNLDCLRRGGRISGAAAMIGKMLSIRPMLEIDPEGKLQVIGKYMGDKKAMKYLIDRFKARYDFDLHPPIFIAYTDNLPLKEELEKMIHEVDPTIEVLAGFIGPVIGSHTGGGALGFGYIAKMEREDKTGK